MKKYLLYFLVFSMILTSGANVYAPDRQTAQQEEDTVSCYPLDVIFVVDQSGSMSDRIYATDPTNQRETAVEAMIDWLASNVLDVCRNVRHQVGVVSFGTEARIDLPLTEVSPDTIEELRALETRLNERVVADDMGLTDPLLAFQMLPEMFAESQIEGGPRKRVVIFLTDGLIDLGDGNNRGMGYVGATRQLVNYINANLPFDPVLLEREGCISFLVEAYGTRDNVPYEKIRECMESYPVEEDAYRNSTYLYVVLMNYGESWPSSVRSQYEEVAESHAGESVDFYGMGGENRQEIPAYFQKALSGLTGVPTGQVDCGGIAVNPYLERAIFVFYKFSPDTQVSLRYTDANGNIHQIVGGQSDAGGFVVEDYQSYGTNERYIFNRPYPGIWFIESDRCASGGINAFYREILINPGGFTLALPSLYERDIEPYYDPTDPVYLEYPMYTDAGVLIDDAEQPVFRVHASATVVDPDGNPVDYQLTWDPDDHLFRSSEPLQVRTSGDYHVSFVGTTRIHTGNLSVQSEVLTDVFDTERVLFQHNDLLFNVGEGEPLVITPVRPEDGQVLPQIHGTIFNGWPLPVMPVHVNVQIQEREEAETDEPLEVPIDQILPDPATAMVAWIQYSDGTESDHITLTPNPSISGNFTGDIPGTITEETMTLHVRLVGTLAPGYQPDQREIDVQFSRHDGLPIYKSGFYILLFVLLILAILAWIAYSIWMRMDKVYGSVDIQKNSITMKVIDLYSGKRITHLKFTPDDGVDLKWIKVKYGPKPKSDDGETVARSIKIWGQTECKQKFNITDLPPDNSAGYCTEHYDFSFYFKDNKENG